jgi:cell division septation protein DedD
MAWGEKRKAGDRVLEGRHVIGLFILMLLFSGVFFTLGYVMGRNQYDGQVRAAPASHAPVDVAHPSKTNSEPSSTNSADASKKPGGTAANPPFSEWEFYHAGSSKPEAKLTKPATPEPAPPRAVAGKGGASAAKPVAAGGKSAFGAPLIPGGAYLLQVAALTNESDALALAENLQKRKFPAFVLTPGADHYYRVQVGPYADAQSADIAKKGLEHAGFKALLKR